MAFAACTDNGDFPLSSDVRNRKREENSKKLFVIDERIIAIIVTVRSDHLANFTAAVAAHQERILLKYQVAAAVTTTDATASLERQQAL